MTTVKRYYQDDLVLLTMTEPKRLRGGIYLPERENRQPITSPLFNKAFFIFSHSIFSRQSLQRLQRCHTKAHIVPFLPLCFCYLSFPKRPVQGLGGGTLNTAETLYM